MLNARRRISYSTGRLIIIELLNHLLILGDYANSYPFTLVVAFLTISPAYSNISLLLKLDLCVFVCLFVCPKYQGNRKPLKMLYIYNIFNGFLLINTADKEIYLFICGVYQESKQFNKT